jgi:recombination protein RecA
MKSSLKNVSENRINVPVVSSSVLQWDVAMSQGGIPRGHIVEIFGMESTGKSTLCWAIAKSFLEQGETALYIDADKETILGDLAHRTLNYMRPKHAEQTFEYLLQFAQTADCIIVDSVNALVPYAELNGGKHDYKAIPRMMSKAIRALVPIIKKSGCVVVFTSQMRMHDKYGNLKSSGGEALENAAALRVELSNVGKGENIETGIKVNFNTIKNTAGTSESVVVPLYFGKDYEAGFERIENENEFRQAHGLPLKQERTE